MGDKDYLKSRLRAYLELQETIERRIKEIKREMEDGQEMQGSQDNRW